MYCFVVCGCVLRLTPSSTSLSARRRIAPFARAPVRAASWRGPRARPAWCVRIRPVAIDRDGAVTGSSSRSEPATRGRHGGMHGGRPERPARTARPMKPEAGGGEREARGQKSTRIRSYGPRLRCVRPMCTPVCDMCSCACTRLRRVTVRMLYRRCGTTAGC